MELIKIKYEKGPGSSRIQLNSKKYHCLSRPALYGHYDSIEVLHRTKTELSRTGSGKSRRYFILVTPCVDAIRMTLVKIKFGRRLLPAGLKVDKNP